MKKCFRIALFIGLLLCFTCCLTGCGGADYDQNDIAAIHQLIDEHGWDIPKDDVKAWDFVTAWSNDNPRRVESIALAKEQPVKGTLDVSAFTGLKFLWCVDNTMEEVILPESIVDITCCYNNRLKVLDLSNVKNLESLSCHDNEQLTSIYYDSLPALKHMWCSDNQLTELNVKGLPNATSIDVASNRLTELDDISSLPNLISIDCSENQITGLHLENLPELETVVCNDNPLLALQIDNTPKLRYVMVYDDVFVKCDSNEFEFVSLDYATRQIVFQQPDVEEINRDKWVGIPEDAVIEGNLLKFTIEAPDGADGITIENATVRKIHDATTVDFLTKEFD